MGLFVLLLVAVQFARGKTVDEIIEKHIQARGGFDKPDEIKAIYMEGIITMMGNTNFVKIYQVQNDLSPVGFNMQWQLTDEKNTLIELAPSTSNVELFNAAVAGIQTEPFITKPLLNYVGNGSQAVLALKEVVNGNDCYRIKLSTKTGSEINYWFNASSSLLSQSLVNDVQQNKTIRSLYSNHKSIDGLFLAHSIEMEINNANENGSIKIFFNKIEITKSFELKFST